MTMTRGTPRRAAARQASSVWACTPSVALTTTTARSTLARAVTISPAKSAYPGVSSRFTLTPLTVKGARLVEMESWRATSSGSKSMTVVPFSTDPRRAMDPGGGQQRLGQRGLAGTVMPDEGDVADGGRVVWHLVPPLFSTGPDWLSELRVYDRPARLARAP